jgi:osmotically-inducible protein OsmY
MKSLLLLILVGCLSVSAGCTAERDYTSEAARESETTMTSSDLKDQVENKIEADPQLRTANLFVNADADRNTVILSGTVESDAERNRAVELARSARPGLTVENHIDVRPSELARADYTPEMARQEVERAKANKETVGDSLDDAWIHAKIVAQLIGDPDTPGRKVNVDVSNNVVTLRGTVETMQEKQEAERIAKETDGVKRVNNRLQVGGKAGN